MSPQPKLRDLYRQINKYDFDKYFTKHYENSKYLCFYIFIWILYKTSKELDKFMNHEWGVRRWIEFVHKCSGDHWGPWASCSWFNFVKASLAFHLQLILFCKSNHVPDSICMAQVIIEFVCDKVKPSQNILIFFVSPLTFNSSLQTILFSQYCFQGNPFDCYQLCWNTCNHFTILF